MAAGVINENPAHELCGNGEKMRPIFPTHAFVVDQPKIGLVDESSGLQAVPRLLAPQVVTSEAAEFVVNNGRKLIEGVLVAGAPSLEQSANFVNRRCFGPCHSVSCVT